jgi:NADH-quinone oxidoreductase subunit M
VLTALIVLPAATAAVVAVLPGRSAAIRVTALVGTLATLGVSVAMLAVFTAGDGGFQLQQEAAWIPDWGASYRLGVDGISLFLVMLTALIGPITVAAAWHHTDRPKGFFAALLVLEAAMLGVFLALDLILFYVFFEVSLVPMYALIGIWGSERRRYAAIKFFLYTLLGGLLMLVGILYLYFDAGAQSFDYTFILQQATLSGTEQTLLFLAFFAAFAIKVPLFPLHTWLPDAHTEAPTAGSVILAAVLLKIGGYGFLRFSLPYFPDASQQLAPIVLALGLVGVLYGALVAMVQRDIKRLVAYSSVAHLGFVVIGVFALNPTGAAGSVVQMVNHGLTTGALFLLVGFLYDRTHDRRINEYSGIMRATPIYGGLFLVTVMSSIALPGLNGFTGELPIMLGTYQTYAPVAVLAAIGVIFAALYLLWAYQRMFHGPVAGKAAGLVDLSAREAGIMGVLVVLMLGIGLYPAPLYERVNPSVERVVNQATEGQAAAATDLPGEVEGQAPPSGAEAPPPGSGDSR